MDDQIYLQILPKKFNKRKLLHDEGEEINNYQISRRCYNLRN